MTVPKNKGNREKLAIAGRIETDGRSCTNIYIVINVAKMVKIRARKENGTIYFRFRTKPVATIGMNIIAIHFISITYP